MKRIGFAFNPTNAQAVELRGRALDWCRERGIDAWSSQAGDHDAARREAPDTDALVVLGGDGTFLRAAVVAAEADVPILGINCGKVGFLSKAESDDLDAVLGRLVEGDFRYEPRMLLDVRILPGGRETGAIGYVALNDAAVVRGTQARVVRLDVNVDESHVATWTADGLVVSSPTGSTGYSFSAGGPILDPTSRNLVVTSIAAYLTAVRTFVVGDGHVVSVGIMDAFDCVVSIDGRVDIPLAVGDEVRVSAHPQPIRFIEPQGALPFWDLLRHKAQLLPS
ncbi:MAG: NAD(+)/NADH kinase [Chloroflexi bacterium]|nr:NAD(+)/NADH kinase [Chloroflexota bacterium]